MRFLASLSFIILILMPFPALSFSNLTERHDTYEEFLTKAFRGCLGYKKNDLFYEMNSGEKYKIPTKGLLEFYVNHRNENASGDFSYLAVHVVRMFKHSDSIMPGIGLFRKNGWVRDADPNFRNTFVDKEIALKTQDFTDMHLCKGMTVDECNNIVLIDEKLNAKWHAKPSEQTSSSWMDRIFWTTPYLNQNFSNFTASNFNFLQGPLIEQLSCKLYRFRETPKETSKKPLRFEIETHGCLALFIRTFSPLSASAYHKYYFVLLGK
ncbi:MAG: hypothetical protein H8E17_20460 [Deltaproteobacteria bacterium]|nr:hypothetical protein [Deltaproteobacteria bacterium]